MSQPPLPESNFEFDPEGFRRWVVSFCIFRFDIERGQVVEECYPPGCLTQDEELEISFSSFPDSISQNNNRSSIHDCIFFFRFPKRRGSLGSSRNSGDNGSEYMYGYVFNRQRQDEKLKRGGEQKSVVILSYYPFLSVFRPLLKIAGPLYFDIGKKALEQMAYYVSTWPAPLFGNLVELPIGNAILKVNLPPAHSLPPEGSGVIDELASSIAPFLPTNQFIPQGLFHDADIFGTFRGIISQLWLLWELLVIGEPILIIAPTPPQCCEAVATLVSLVAPILCSVDFRPYFTIHDPDFASLNSLTEGDSFPPLILGVTNLFFLKSLRCIPHIVSVGNPAVNSSKPALAPNSSLTGKRFGNPEGSGFQKLSLKRLSPTNLLSSIKLRRAGPLCLMTEHKEAVWSTYTATIKPDTAILNRLIDAGMSPSVEESMSVVNNEILRRHFLELTTNFLAPFGPYLRATTPSEGASPFIDPPPLPSFNADTFLASLSGRGPGKFLSKRMKANWLDLYRRFLNGHNFMPWFQRRRAVAEQEQLRLWRQARMRTEIQQYLSKMSELEIVDSFNVIEKHLHGEIEQLGHSSVDSAVTCQKLMKDLQTVFKMLPNDMQQLLLLKPQTAALLQGSLDS